MVPSLFYQNQRKMYADIPFTRCRGSKNTEIDGHRHDPRAYREETCLMLVLYLQVCSKCSCYPPYVDNMDAYNQFNDGALWCKPCTFSQHALCAAEVIDHFEWSDREQCPIACESEKFHRTSIEYIYGDDVGDKGDLADVSSTGIAISLSEIVNVIMEEHKTYDLTAFMSDTGGAAGLFLGLNIIDLLHKLSYFMKYIQINNVELFHNPWKRDYKLDLEPNI